MRVHDFVYCNQAAAELRSAQQQSSALVLQSKMDADYKKGQRENDLHLIKHVYDQFTGRKSHFY